MLREQLRRIVANWLRQGMALRDVNAVQLATQSGVSRPTISEILNARTDAEDATLERLAQALSIPLPALQGVPDLAAGEPAATFAASGADLFEELVRRPDEFTRRLMGTRDHVGVKAALAWLDWAEGRIVAAGGSEFRPFLVALRDRVRTSKGGARDSA